MHILLVYSGKEYGKLFSGVFSEVGFTNQSIKGHNRSNTLFVMRFVIFGAAAIKGSRERSVLLVGLFVAVGEVVSGCWCLRMVVGWEWGLGRVSAAGGVLDCE